MSKLSTKSKAVIAGVAVVSLAGSGVAYAYWTTTGSGSGQATTGSNAASLTVAQSGSPSLAYPGAPASTISATVSNSATYSQNGGAVAALLTGVKSGSTGADISATCGTGNYAIVNDPAAVVGTLTKAGTAGASKTLAFGTIQLVETGANQDACQGAIPTFSISVAQGS